MEVSLGVRVVRGPDWCWEDHDGGEGCVGTVVEVGDEGRSVLVQWDRGIRSWYRSGEEGKFDLRVLDTAPTGMNFPDIICSGCYVEGVAGMHWQCAHCYEYHLCHSCYLLGRHCQEHPFFRVQSKKPTLQRVLVSSRLDTKVEAKGIFPGAEVVRGPHWRFKDQDGGAGNPGRVVAIEGWQGQTARSIARVEWSAAGTQTNVYRVGFKGKVDLSCTTVGIGGLYCPEHLPILGSSSQLTYFNEDKIVSGDMVYVELEPDLFKRIHEANHLWADTMAELYGACGVVTGVPNDQDIVVSFLNGVFILIADTVTKMQHCRVGATVKVVEDSDELHQLQAANGIWNDDMVLLLDQVGRIDELLLSGAVVVAINGRLWTLSSRAVRPARGIVPPDIPITEHTGVMANTVVDYKRLMSEAGLPDGVLDGDLVALSNVLGNNIKTPTQLLKDQLLCYYAVKGHLPAMDMLLRVEHSLDPNLLFPDGRPLIDILVLVHQEEAAIRLVQAGADINAKDGNLLRIAVAFGCFQLLKHIVQDPRTQLNTTDLSGETILSHAVSLSKSVDVAALLAAKADATTFNSIKDNPIIWAARNGFVSSMEQFAIHTPELLSIKGKLGAIPLTVAARFNRTIIVNLLAAQNCVDINEETPGHVTALHVAAQFGHYAVVECLVGWGAELNGMDSSGDTPLSLIVKKKKHTGLTSPQLKQVMEELSLASEGKAVEEYVAVVCFLVREGADWDIEAKSGVCPHQALSPQAVTLISDYVKNHPKAFRGSYCGTQQRIMQELPQKFCLSSHASKNYADFKTGAGPDKHCLPGDCAKNVLVAKNMGGKRDDPACTNPKEQGQLCKMCEDLPACVQFSPCGHTVLCTMCAQRAKKCFECKALVESKSLLQ